MCSFRSWEVKKQVSWSSAFIVSSKRYKAAGNPVYIKRESIDQFRLLFFLVWDSSATTQSKIETQHVISWLKCFQFFETQHVKLSHVPQLNFLKDWPMLFHSCITFWYFNCCTWLNWYPFLGIPYFIFPPDFDQNNFSNTAMDLYLLKKAFLINTNMLISIS
jgi:hypothetical protein